GSVLVFWTVVAAWWGGTIWGFLRTGMEGGMESIAASARSFGCGGGTAPGGRGGFLARKSCRRRISCRQGPGRRSNSWVGRTPACEISAFLVHLSTSVISFFFVEFLLIHIDVYLPL
ncbi:hypothetical protein GW17_00034200, partial [Ensete ventricosum]